MTDKVGTEDSMAGFYGEPHQFDPDFKGPIHKRSCTDIICLLFFIVLLGVWGAVFIIAIMAGNPSRLLYPTDSKGQVCGLDDAVVDKPFLVFFDMTRCASPKVPYTGCPTPQVCVKECPTENWFFLAGSSNNRSKLICKDGVDRQRDLSELILNQDCAPYYVASESIAKRCIPSSLYSFTDELLENSYHRGKNMSQKDKFDSITKSLTYVARFVRFQQVAEGVVEDIKTLWPYIIAGCALSMVVSFLWIFLLRLVARFMVWFSLILFTAICGFGAYYTLNRYLQTRASMEAKEMTPTVQAFSMSFSKVEEMETTWLVLFIITLVVFVICLLVVIFLRKRIALAVSLINEASKAVGSVMSTLVFPIVPDLIQMLFLFLFCVTALLLSSAGKANYTVMCNDDKDCACLSGSSYSENSTCDPKDFWEQNPCEKTQVSCHFFSYVKDPNILRLHFFNLFALFWSVFFIGAFEEMVLAGAFSAWYWTFNKSNLEASPVLSSIGRALRYHTGTLAFGSLIIAIVRMIRVIFEYIDQKIRQHTDTWIVKCLSCCCRCCLWMLEKFLRFINRNAYIYCAIYGTNFLVSAKKSFSLVMRNILRVTVLDKVTDFLLLIGKLVVTLGMAMLSFVFFTHLSSKLPHMNYYMTPVFIIAVATYIISSAFFSVYEMAVDTLFMCFLEDCERNDGTPDKPYFMSKSLMKILSKENKVVDKEVQKEE